jgi:hypothetical protein
MASYCTVEDVQEQMRHTFSISGHPTPDEVDGMIVNISSRLNGVAQAAGYTVPVTGTLALELMKEACVNGVSCRAWHTGFLSQDAPSRVEYWCQEYKDFLAALRKGEVELPGLTPESDLDPVFAIVQQPPRDQLWTGDDEPLE